MTTATKTFYLKIKRGKKHHLNVSKHVKYFISLPVLANLHALMEIVSEPYQILKSKVRNLHSVFYKKPGFCFF